jgi:hypothetical protein
MRRVTLTSLALLAVGAAALPGSAAAQAPDGRAAAREYSYAAYRLRVKVKAAAPALNRAVSDLFNPRCGVDASGTPEQTKAIEHKADTLSAEAVLGTVYAPVAGAFSTFQTELDRVPTADPALVAGREAWRATVVFVQQLQPVPADLCARIRAWADSGYADAALPILQPAPVHELLAAAPDSDEPDLPAPGLRRAGARMLQLGVTKGQARRFEGVSLFRGVALFDLASDDPGA